MRRLQQGWPTKRSAEAEDYLRNDKISSSTPSGAIAQLGERIVRNDEVVGSIPTSSTKYHALAK